MTAPPDPRPGPPRDAARCRHCPAWIWPLNTDPVMWEDIAGLTICQKAGPGDPYLPHTPLPPHRGPATPEERAAARPARRGPDPNVIVMTPRQAGRIMRGWHSAWPAYCPPCDPSSLWAHDPWFCLTRIEGDGHTLYVVPEMVSGADADLMYGSWGGFAVLDIPAVPDPARETAQGAILRIGFATYGDALRHAAIRVCDEPPSGYPRPGKE